MEIEGGDLIRKGMIILWYGNIASIPQGWALCDGNNGTPDLRNKFIICANADDGGTAKTTITGVATQTGGSYLHTHTIGALFVTGILSAGTEILNSGAGSFNHYLSGATSSTSTGNNNTIIPYYALAYIMKL